VVHPEFVVVSANIRNQVMQIRRQIPGCPPISPSTGDPGTMLAGMVATLLLKRPSFLFLYFFLFYERQPLENIYFYR
jgi:hypothetical protein